MELEDILTDINKCLKTLPYLLPTPRLNWRMQKSLLNYLWVACTFAGLLLSVLIHGRQPLIESFPDTRTEARAELGIIDAYGNTKTTTHCARPTARVSVGIPPVALTLGVDPDPSNSGFLIWSPKILQSSTLRYVQAHTHGWHAIDLLNMGALVTHRAGMGDDSFGKGLTVNMLILDEPMAYGCDGLIGITPFGRGNSILTRFTYAQFSGSFATFMSSHAFDTLHHLRTELDLSNAEVLQRAKPTDTVVRSGFSLLGVLHNATVTFTDECAHHNTDLADNVEVGLWSVPTLQPGQEGSSHLTSTQITGPLVAAINCFCNDNHVIMRVNGNMIDQYQLCQTIRINDNALSQSSISLPWSTTCSSLGFGINHTTQQAYAHWLSAADSGETLLYYTLFAVYITGSLLWYLRDGLTPVPTHFATTYLQQASVQQIMLEFKLHILTLGVFLVIAYAAPDAPATSSSLYNTFTFPVRILSNLLLAVCCTSACITSNNDTAYDMSLLSITRSYATSGMIAATLAELGRYCVVGITRHAFLIALWVWNLRSQIDFVVRLAGANYITYLLQKVIALTVQQDNIQTPKKQVHDGVAALTLAACTHCSFFAGADALDVSLGTASVILPVYGSQAVWLITVIFVYDAANLILQRHTVGQNVLSQIQIKKKK